MSTSSVDYRLTLTFPPSPTQPACSRNRPPILPPLASTKPSAFTFTSDGPLHPGGLRTSPAEDMSTAYQAQGHPVPPYDSHIAQPYASTYIADVHRSRNIAPDYFPPARYAATQASSQSQSSLSQAMHSASSAVYNQPSSRHSTRPSTPTSYTDSTAPRRGSVPVTLPQVPADICENGGNVADFAALITCLFWFESHETVATAEKSRDARPESQAPRLSRSTIPPPSFKKWLQNIIQTTQVSANVVLLALMFIYRLKQVNTKVRGRPGSEYRLLTVALMLGNKFLDDNTYTNKTWAEVSGIGVQEIHVMEVEFLSNMRYNLYASAEDWKQWKLKLKNFYEYCEQAQAREPSPINIPSPSRSFHSPLPSPTGNTLPVGTPSSRGPSSNGWQYQQERSPLSSRPSLQVSRKRSFEGDPTEPPAKRVTRQSIPQAHGVAVSQGPPASGTLRLPAPTLSLNTQLPPTTQPQVTYAPQPSISLPPLTHGVRAMATVYSSATPVPATTSYAPQLPIVTTTGTPTTIAPSYPNGYHTPTKKHSPTNTLHPPPYASSPLDGGFPSGVRTPVTQSPSFYLQQRNSPYRPVRHVNTLLYPPASSLQQYHLAPSQMQYMPLGRRNDVRTGLIIPEQQLMGLRNQSGQIPQTTGVPGSAVMQPVYS